MARRPRGTPVSADDVMGYIKAHVAQHGYPPSMQAICDHCGMPSKSTAFKRVSQLVEEGRIVIERVPTAPGGRVIRIVETP